MDKQRENLLQEIGKYLSDVDKSANLTATVSNLESENVRLKRELENLPTEQTTYYDKADEEVEEKARMQDIRLEKKINKIFLAILAGLTVINAVLMLAMVNKDGVAGKMLAMNMNFPNYTTEEVISVIFPLMIILAVIFQIVVILGAIFIAKNIEIGERQKYR